MTIESKRSTLERQVAEASSILGSAPPTGFVERILEGRTQFEKDCNGYFAEAQNRGVPFLIVANGTLDDPGESHYPIYVKDAEKFWKTFVEHDGRNMQQVVRVFRFESDAPAFPQQFEVDPQAIKRNPNTFGFPPRRSGNDGLALTAETPEGPK